jgi:hypothetical protein
MKGLLFFGFLLIVLLVASYGLQQSGTKEGFVNPGSNASLLAPQVIVPKVNPKPAPLEIGTPAPYLPPAEKEYGPAFGDIARVNTLPYKDPSLEAAPYERIAELLESLKAFFAFEAKSLEKRSDPQIQLPLTTARGDMVRLSDEVAVLKRNPGIGSMLTQGQVDDIQANLAYLQRQYRLSVNSLSGRTGLIEGFEDKEEEVSPRLTVKQVEELITRVDVEMARLSASGTTDPLLTARVNTLRDIKNQLQTIVVEVQNGTKPEASIPILKSDMDTFLPVMGKPSEPLPQLINSLNLPPSLSNLFPATGSGDISASKTAQTLFANYGDALLKGLSWDIELKYTSPGEIEAEKAKRNVMVQSYGSSILKEITDNLQPLNKGLKQPVFMTAGLKAPGSDLVAFPRGEMESATAEMEMDRLENRMTPAGAPAKFDWKKKSAEICDEIRKRGLDPKDFGCLDPSKVTSQDFSWRGHARMVCTRLLTTPDPGLPETCGCPPLNWPGWRS